MKTTLFFLFIVAFSQFAEAQEVNCVEKENQLSQNISDKEYEKAYTGWNEIKNSCPKFSEKIYSLGNEVLQYNIEIAAPEKKEEKVRELLNLYDLYDKNFPNNTNGNFEKRALALKENHAGTDEEIFGFLDAAFEKQRTTFTNPQALFYYFQYYYEKYKSGKNEITLEKLIDKYAAVAALTESNSQKYPNKADEYSRVVQGLDSFMGELLSCDNLTKYVHENYELHKSDATWLLATAKVLSTKCKTNPVFGTVATQLYAVQPSSKSAYYLADYNLSSGEQDKAVALFSKSIALSTDKADKAATSYAVASILSTSDKAKAKEMMFSAIENNPSNGKYFIFLANLYASSIGECAATENEKKALYKLASDTVLKAGIVEPRLKVTSENRSQEYLKNVTFDKKDKVKSVVLGCWINQTIQFNK